VCAVSTKQWMGCYQENARCKTRKRCRRVKSFVSGIPKKQAENELRKCAMACRSKNSLFFAKTVSKSLGCCYDTIQYIYVRSKADEMASLF